MMLPSESLNRAALGSGVEQSIRSRRVRRALNLGKYLIGEDFCAVPS
jgi:hypothetical protein